MQGFEKVFDGLVFGPKITQQFTWILDGDPRLALASAPLQLDIPGELAVTAPRGFGVSRNRSFRLHHTSLPIRR